MCLCSDSTLEESELISSVTYSCPDRTTRDTWELFCLCCRLVPARNVPSSTNLVRTPNPASQPGASATAALLPPSLTRRCAVGRATVPVSPRPLCSSSSCYVALCWRPSSCIGTLCLRPPTEARPLPCVTVPTDSTSAGGLGSHLRIVNQSSPAAVRGESGRSTPAQTDSTAACDRPGWRLCRPARMENSENVSTLESRDSPHWLTQ